MMKTLADVSDNMDFLTELAERLGAVRFIEHVRYVISGGRLCLECVALGQVLLFDFDGDDDEKTAKLIALGMLQQILELQKSLRPGRQPLAMIAAFDESGAIGCDGKIPWRHPEDLDHFKRKTMGHPVIMGRKTFESLKRPLRGRTNIVLTRNRDYEAPEDVHVVFTPEKALEVARSFSDKMPFVIGGGAVYGHFLKYATELYLTRVDGHCDDADTFFPHVNFHGWEQVKRWSSGEAPLTYYIWKRKEDDVIKVALSDWSKTPGGRYSTEGKWSAEEFRESVLSPVLKRAIYQGRKVKINLDKTAGTAHSFLEELAGGVVRQFAGQSIDWLAVLSFESVEEPRIARTAQTYMREQVERSYGG